MQHLENLFSILVDRAIETRLPASIRENHSTEIADRSVIWGRHLGVRSLFAGDQGVANLLQQLHFARWWRLGRGRLLLLAAEPVHGFDRHEEDERHYQEGDQGAPACLASASVA
jgi:hypothetical protein